MATKQRVTDAKFEVIRGPEPEDWGDRYMRPSRWPLWAKIVGFVFIFTVIWWSRYFAAQPPASEPSPAVQTIPSASPGETFR
jgi:hypothetical protein